MTTPSAGRPGHHVVVVGAGGNIGSHLVPHLARMRDVTRLTLIDPDHYELHNTRNQAITVAQVGRSKVEVQAAAARAIDPHLVVRTFAEPVEDVPLMRLRGDVILSCLDSRRARQYLNEVARHLGVPWIDAGVLGMGRVARIDLYLPAPDAPCLECRWDSTDYEAVEQRYPCSEPDAPGGSDAPSALGALAASLQALACQQLLEGNTTGDALGAGDQVVIVASHHRHYRTAHKRSARCRLGDHAVWAIEPLSLDRNHRTIGALFTRVEVAVGAATAPELRVPGRQFAQRETCTHCDNSRPVLRALRAKDAECAPCVHCSGPMVVTGFGVVETLSRTMLTPSERGRSLRSIGLRDGDVITVETTTTRRHFALELPTHPHRETATRAGASTETP